MEPEHRVEFADDQIRSQLRAPISNQTPFIITWVLSHSGGRVTTETQAQRVLIGFFIIGCILSFILFRVKGGTEAKIQAPRGNEIIYDGGPPHLAVPVQ